MSDHWIVLIPEDPLYVPSQRQRKLALQRLAAIVPKSESIEACISDGIEFVDCGGNFESIACPHCGQDLSIAWWTDRLDDDRSDDGFRLDSYRLPCCGRECTLHQLEYHWPQGFAHFALEAMNPGIARLDDVSRCEIERILDSKLRVIDRHL